MLTLTSVCQN